MAWTYAALKAAITALNPMPADMPGIVAAINGQLSSVILDITVSDIDKIVVPTGELFALQQLSSAALSGTTPPTQRDQVIVAAWNFSQILARWTTLETRDSQVWASSRAVLVGLQAAGVLSSASVAAITALRSGQTPVWQPPVTTGDIQTAEAQP